MPQRGTRMLLPRHDFLKLLAIAGASFGAGTLSRRTAAAGQAQGKPAARRAPDFKKIKALAFDAYGTLFDVHSVVALGERLFPGQGTALSNTWRLKQLQYTWGRSLMGRYQDFWKVTEDGLVFAARSLKLELDSAKRQQLMDAYLSLAAFPDVAEGLQELKEAGYKLAILSNGSPRMLQDAAKSAKIDRFLSWIVSVDEIKIYKPSPRVYELAPKRLETGPQSIGFVSSNSWDVAGAASFGLTTFWINRGKQPMDELGFPADKEVEKITDLPALLKAA